VCIPRHLGPRSPGLEVSHNDSQELYTDAPTDSDAYILTYLSYLLVAA
jgi:hypothetical protein